MFSDSEGRPQYNILYKAPRRGYNPEPPWPDLRSLYNSTSLSSCSLSFFATLPFQPWYEGSRAMPSLRHLRGGFTPTAALCSQTCLPRLNQRSWRCCSSSTDGCHLLFKMRRIASAETSNLSASASVVYTSGNWALSARMPARASGDSLFRGRHPSGNFCLKASFCVCHASWSLVLRCSAVPSCLDRLCLSNDAESPSLDGFDFPPSFCLYSFFLFGRSLLLLGRSGLPVDLGVMRGSSSRVVDVGFSTATSSSGMAFKPAASFLRIGESQNERICRESWTAPVLGCETTAQPRGTVTRGISNRCTCARPRTKVLHGDAW